MIRVRIASSSSNTILAAAGGKKYFQSSSASIRSRNGDGWVARAGGGGCIFSCKLLYTGVVHRPPLVTAAAYTGLHGGDRYWWGDDRGSIYRNGDLYIARRGLCIASTHPGPVTPLAPSPQSLRRPPTPTSRAHRSALRIFASGNVRGCAGVSAGVRDRGVVRGAGRFNETRPHHPLRARSARETSLT